MTSSTSSVTTTASIRSREEKAADRYDRRPLPHREKFIVTFSSLRFVIRFYLPLSYPPWPWLCLVWHHVLSVLLFYHCYLEFSVWSGFHVNIQNTSHLLWFCFTMLSDWQKISRHFQNPSEVKPKPIVTHSQILTLVCVGFWLVHWIVSVLCDWLEWLLWIWFSELPFASVSKRVLVQKSSNQFL